MRDTVAVPDPATQPGGRSGSGLGLSVTELSCGVTLWGHSGGIPGFTTYATRADGGRQLTLSLNPFTQKLPDGALMDVYETAYCDR